MTRHFALECGGLGINFNIVQAGLVETDSFLQLPMRDRMRAANDARNLTSGRRLTPDDVANVVAFLSSPLSDLIQGQTVIVDAGNRIIA
jgi:enoyl-[acyl-carrier protein] reductase III